VRGVAFYPNNTLNLILDASTHPLELHQAASESDGNRPPPPPFAQETSQPESIKRLAAESPDTLHSLDETLILTVALGLVYRSQPDDVWTAVEAVREREGNGGTNRTKSDDRAAGSDLVTELLQSAAAQELAGKVEEFSSGTAQNADNGTNVIIAPNPEGRAAAHAADRAAHAARQAANTRALPASRIAAYNAASKTQFATGQRALQQNWNQISKKVVKPGNGFAAPRGRTAPPFGRR